MIDQCRYCSHNGVCKYKDEVQRRVDEIKTKMEEYRDTINTSIAESESNSVNKHIDIRVNVPIDIKIGCIYFLDVNSLFRVQNRMAGDKQ